MIYFYDDLGFSQLKNAYSAAKAGLGQGLFWHLKSKSFSRTVLSKIVNTHGFSALEIELVWLKKQNFNYFKINKYPHMTLATELFCTDIEQCHHCGKSYWAVLTILHPAALPYVHLQQLRVTVVLN